MQSTRARDTKPELALRSELHRRGRRFRVCTRPVREVRRTADIVFTKQHLAVFLDGCFWHSCPDHYIAPKQNAEFWSDKITTNWRRDQATDALLKKHGWIVLRIWEHVPLTEAADAVEAAIDRVSAS
jgi:DNA mismatch endonuclease, patch repair protein